MEDENKFIEEFIAAAKAEDGEKMKTISQEVTKLGLTQRTELLEKLVAAMKKEEVNEEITSGLAATLELMKANAEEKTDEDSAVEEAKDEKSKADEATQDVAADDSAEADANLEAEVGNAPAEEEKAEKTEQ